MFNHSKNKAEQKNNQEDQKNQQPTYWERVIKGKGTVAEPWPTAKELWNDPEVKDAINAHNESVESENNTK